MYVVHCSLLACVHLCVMHRCYLNAHLLLMLLLFTFYYHLPPLPFSRAVVYLSVLILLLGTSCGLMMFPAFQEPRWMFLRNMVSVDGRLRATVYGSRCFFFLRPWLFFTCR